MESEGSEITPKPEIIVKKLELGAKTDARDVKEAQKLGFPEGAQQFGDEAKGKLNEAKTLLARFNKQGGRTKGSK